MEKAKVRIELPDGKVMEFEAGAHDFKSGTHGFYFRNRVEGWHTQLVISKK